MKTIATIILTIAIACFIICPVCADCEVHEEEALVISLNIANEGVWRVSAVTQDGEEFAWYADNADGEYWHIGDLVLMEIWHDEVIDVLFIGELTPVGASRWLGW